MSKYTINDASKKVLLKKGLSELVINRMTEKQVNLALESDGNFETAKLTRRRKSHVLDFANVIIALIKKANDTAITLTRTQVNNVMMALNVANFFTIKDKVSGDTLTSGNLTAGDVQFMYENQAEFEFLPTEKLSNNRDVKAGADLKSKVILTYQAWVRRGEQYVNSHVIKTDNVSGLNASKLGVTLEKVSGENITFKISA